jgi:guanylate kinase
MITSSILRPYQNSLTQDKDNPYIYKISEPENISNKRLILILSAPSGSGKDAILRMLKKRGVCEHAVTGTSRGRRFEYVPEFKEEVSKNLTEDLSVDEYENKYEQYLKEGKIVETEKYEEHIWLRKKREDETVEEYMQSEDLLEGDFHYGNIYGLPRSSFLQAYSVENKVPVVRTDISGLESLKESLKEYGNVLSIALVADSWEQVEESLLNREDNIDIEKIRGRIEKDKKDIERYMVSPNFIVHNTREKVGDISGLENTYRAVVSLIEKYS